jgi:hypothetical protein
MFLLNINLPYLIICNEPPVTMKEFMSSSATAQEYRAPLNSAICSSFPSENIEGNLKILN